MGRKLSVHLRDGKNHAYIQTIIEYCSTHTNTEKDSKFLTQGFKTHSHKKFKEFSNNAKTHIKYTLFHKQYKQKVMKKCETNVRQISLYLIVL